MRSLKLSFFFVYLLLFTNTAQAYIDPGLTGLIYQLGYLAVGAVVAWFAGAKFYFYKLIGKNNKPKQSQQQSESPAENTTQEQSSL